MKLLELVHISIYRKYNVPIVPVEINTTDLSQVLKNCNRNIFNTIHTETLSISVAHE